MIIVPSNQAPASPDQVNQRSFWKVVSLDLEKKNIRMEEENQDQIRGNNTWEDQSGSSRLLTDGRALLSSSTITYSKEVPLAQYIKSLWRKRVSFVCREKKILSQVVLTRSEPAGSVMFRHVPCNRIPAGFSPDEFRSVPVHSSTFRLGSRRNLSGEKPAGIRLQGTWRNITDPTGSCDRNDRPELLSSFDAWSMDTVDDLEQFLSVHWSHQFASADPNTPITLSKISTRNRLTSFSTSSLNSLHSELQYLLDLSRFMSKEHRVPVPLLTPTDQFHENERDCLDGYIDGKAYADINTCHLSMRTNLSLSLSCLLWTWSVNMSWVVTRGCVFFCVVRCVISRSRISFSVIQLIEIFLQVKCVWLIENEVQTLLDFKHIKHETSWRDLPTCLSRFCITSDPHPHGCRSNEANLHRSRHETNGRRNRSNLIANGTRSFSIDRRWNSSLYTQMRQSNGLISSLSRLSVKQNTSKRFFIALPLEQSSRRWATPRGRWWPLVIIHWLVTRGRARARKRKRIENEKWSDRLHLQSVKQHICFACSTDRRAKDETIPFRNARRRRRRRVAQVRWLLIWWSLDFISRKVKTGKNEDEDEEEFEMNFLKQATRLTSRLGETLNRLGPNVTRVERKESWPNLSSH